MTLRAFLPSQPGTFRLRYGFTGPPWSIDTAGSKRANSAQVPVADYGSTGFRSLVSFAGAGNLVPPADRSPAVQASELLPVKHQRVAMASWNFAADHAGAVP